MLHRWSRLINGCMDNEVAPGPPRLFQESPIECLRTAFKSDDVTIFLARRLRKPRKTRKARGRGGGDVGAAVGSVKFTAKHLFVCDRAIVRRTFNKPRVLREKIFEWRKKIKNNKTKKNSETFSSVRHQNCSSRGFRFKCKWKFSCFNFFSEWNWRTFAWKVTEFVGNLCKFSVSIGVFGDKVVLSKIWAIFVQVPESCFIFRRAVLETWSAVGLLAVVTSQLPAFCGNSRSIAIIASLGSLPFVYIGHVTRRWSFPTAARKINHRSLIA